MRIRNILEDIVEKQVEEIFTDTEMMEKLGICTCDQCRLDVVCYALNRLTPRYIVSGKGAAHIETEFTYDPQNATDIVSIINDGIKQVKNQKRPACSHSPAVSEIRGPYINFPNITGRVFHGQTFEPLSNLSISLLFKGKPVEMMNSNWTNPYVISASTPGTYNFWPKPVTAKSMESETFQFELEIPVPSSETEQFHFTLELNPEDTMNQTFDLESSFRVEDIYVFNR